MFRWRKRLWSMSAAYSILGFEGERGPMQGGGNGQELPDVIRDLWQEVIRAVNRILDGDRRFGFVSIEQSLDPKLSDIIHGLSVIDAVLSSLLDSGLLEYEETRQALNSKQCVIHIRRLAAALKKGDKDDYNKAIELLDKQAKF
jgi:hypothetical protein